MSHTVVKIISGGQTGADRTALEVGRALGLQTGGWVPKGCRTAEGSDYSLLAFGCAEHPSPLYPPRTEANVADSDGTVWFGHRSPGYTCTRKAWLRLHKPSIENPTSAALRAW